MRRLIRSGAGATLVAGALLVVATLAVFWRVPGHGFVGWDDDTLVFDNPDLNPVTPRSLRALWRTLTPLTFTLWALVAEAGRLPDGTLDPRAFHAAGLALHVGSVLLVFGILRRLVARPWAAAAGALLFALHPVQVEPVAWVTGMRDLLSGCLALLALRLYLPFAAGGPARRRAWCYGGATLAFVLALLAKPTAAFVPLTAWALDRWMLGRPTRRSLVALAPWMAAAVAWGALTKAAQPDSALAFVTPLWARPLVAADALAFHLRKLVLPFELAPDYGRTPEVVLRSGPLHLAVVAAGALVAFGAVGRWRRPWLLAAVGVFVTALLPVLGLLPFLFQRFSTVADRYLYLALLGPALALAWGLARHGRPVAVTLCGVALALLGLRSAHQTRVWADSFTLLEHALARNPGSWMAHTNLGAELQRAGRIPEAIAHYEEAIRIRPDWEYAHRNLAALLADEGRTAEAIARWEEALRWKPDFILAHYGLAITLQKAGRPAEAAAHYEEAVRLDPEFVEAYYNLGNVLLGAQRYDDAIAHYRIALRLRPELAEAHSNLAVALVAVGRTDEAIGEYTEALRLRPDLAQVHQNLAFALAARGRSAEAIAHYREALRIDPTLVAAERGLARALEAEGRTTTE